MPDTKSSKNDNDNDAKSGGPTKIIVAALLCVGLLGGGYFVGGMGSGEAATPVAAPEAEAAAAEEEVKEIGELIQLEPVNINLQDGHFLRVAVALEISHDDTKAKEAEVEEEFPIAPAQDLVLATFSGRTIEELSSTEGREQARKDLHEALVETYGAKVYNIYLTQFVMQ